MNYSQAIRFLFDLEKFGIKLGLDNTYKLLKYLGNPHQNFSSLHIAGSNGKGSLCAMLHSVLSQAGFKTGLYTSPHLVDFRERIKIDHKQIEKEFVTDFVRDLKERILKNKYTFFEVATALSFLYFQRQKVDLAVVETGLGGRFDSTNVLVPLVSVITNISLEHTDRLGKTIPKIAFEKAGIIKSRVPVVTAETSETVLKVFHEISEIRKANLIQISHSGKWKMKKSNLQGNWFSYAHKGEKKSIYFVNLAGFHQIKNAVLALETLKILEESGFDISADVKKRGLENVTWPGRFQVYRKKPLLILDVAHNPEGMKIFLHSLEKLLPHQRKTFVFGVMKDKDYFSMLKEISKTSEKVIFTSPGTTRAAELESLVKTALRLKLKFESIPSVIKATRKAIREASPNEVVCVTGSHYTVGEILAAKSLGQG